MSKKSPNADFDAFLTLFRALAPLSARDLVETSWGFSGLMFSFTVLLGFGFFGAPVDAEWVRPQFLTCVILLCPRLSFVALQSPRYLDGLSNNCFLAG